MTLAWSWPGPSRGGSRPIWPRRARRPGLLPRQPRDRGTGPVGHRCAPGDRDGSEGGQGLRGRSHGRRATPPVRRCRRADRPSPRRGLPSADVGRPAGDRPRRRRVAVWHRPGRQDCHGELAVTSSSTVRSPVTKRSIGSPFTQPPSTKFGPLPSALALVW